MRTIVLGSGRGTNCKSLLEAENSGLLGTASIVCILSDVKDSGILKIAKEFGVRSHCPGSLASNNYSSNSHEFNEDEWIDIISKEKPDLIVLAGFMKVLSTQFINSFDGKIINLHPSLLPSFRGLDAIKQAWDAGVKITGCTVHWVSPVLDSGEIIAQSPVRIMPGDTLESVSAKVHAAEHMLLPSVIAQLAMHFN